ncbi:MFS transporter [Bradyrhizobium roseum]|uniref:MFS transporter n=1 Tax=Bradyrhizobium roseum TaxID=3056648 RepID=UPI002605D879|nr:MFS transporter [Bradyrhizobium roseus]WKA26478.1 MFS transporter [Bradyrhizobium roseus]
MRKTLLPSRRTAAPTTFRSARDALCTDAATGSDIQGDELRPSPRRAALTPLRAFREGRRFLSGNRMLITRVFLPFAAGFYLSYLFRTINALVAAPLTSDLGLAAGDLGLLTSAFFLTFAAAQIPVGVLLDRYGPRRVQSALLSAAAAGAALFAVSDDFFLLLAARALMGLGVAGALNAGLKALVVWFPNDQLPLLNGFMVMLGALGAVTATLPADWLLASIGWRALFVLFAAVTVGCAILIYVVVPETAKVTTGPAAASLKEVYTDPRFWRVVPLSAATIGTAWALHGLWAAQWLTDVEGLNRTAMVWHLFVMAVAVSLGALLWGVAADGLRRRDIGPQAVLGVVAAVFVAAQLALILRWPLSSYLLWAIIAAVGAGTILGYAILAEQFPKALAGRANALLNFFHIGAAFAVQIATGLVLQHWSQDAGRYPEIAYQTAFAINLGLQILAGIWFGLPWVFGIVKRTFRASSKVEPTCKIRQVSRASISGCVPPSLNGRFP